MTVAQSQSIMDAELVLGSADNVSWLCVTHKVRCFTSPWATHFLPLEGLSVLNFHNYSEWDFRFALSKVNQLLALEIDLYGDINRLLCPLESGRIWSVRSPSRAGKGEEGWGQGVTPRTRTPAVTPGCPHLLPEGYHASQSRLLYWRCSPLFPLSTSSQA